MVVEFGGDLLLTQLYIGGIEWLMSSRFFTAVALCDLLCCIPPVRQRVETLDNAMGQLSLKYK